jgi:hypothetical protein
MPQTIAKFVEGLKQHLQAREDLGGWENKGKVVYARYEIDGCGSTRTGQWGHCEVDWDVLNKEIDAFVAEFNK